MDNKAIARLAYMLWDRSVSREECERIICRAAAEICGLTGNIASRLADQTDADYWGSKANVVAALRKYAELVKEE